MWTIFKVFIEFVTILLLFYVLVFWLRGMWDLSCLIRDRTRTPCVGRRSLNHWIMRDVPVPFLSTLFCDYPPPSPILIQVTSITSVSSPGVSLHSLLHHHLNMQTCIHIFIRDSFWSLFGIVLDSLLCILLFSVKIPSDQLVEF